MRMKWNEGRLLEREWNNQLEETVESWDETE